MFSQSEENYIKAIYHLEVSPNKGISTNAIAEKLETKASSVSDMIKKLSAILMVSTFQKSEAPNISLYSVLF